MLHNEVSLLHLNICCSRGAVYMGPEFQHRDEMNVLGPTGCRLVRTSPVQTAPQIFVQTSNVEFWEILIWSLNQCRTYQIWASRMLLSDHECNRNSYPLIYIILESGEDCYPMDPSKDGQVELISPQKSIQFRAFGLLNTKLLTMLLLFPSIAVGKVIGNHENELFSGKYSSPIVSKRSLWTKWTIANRSQTSWHHEW